MKFKLLFSCFISILFFTGCEDKNKTNVHSNNEIQDVSSQKQLSEHDQKIIQKYNDSISMLMNEGQYSFKQKLTELLPEIKTIENTQERNLILMNIYLQLGDFEQAYLLNEQQLKKEVTSHRQSFKCMLMQQLKYDKDELKQCYQLAASELKKVIDQNPKEEKDLVILAQGEYYLYMFKAGHITYLKQFEFYQTQVKDEFLRDRLELMKEQMMLDQPFTQN